MSYPPPPGDPQQPSGDGPQDGGGMSYPPPGSTPPPPPPYGPPGGQPPYDGGQGYGGGPGYGGPGGPGGYGGGYGGPPQSSSKALWSMIIGIVSVPLACYACLGWIGIAAIVMGNQARKEIAASGGMQTGEGQAKAGVILGWIGVALGTIVLIANIGLLATGNSTFDYNFDTAP